MGKQLPRRVGDRRRSDRRRIPARCSRATPPTTGTWPAACAARRSSLPRQVSSDMKVPAYAEIVIEFRSISKPEGGRPARRIHRLLHAGLAQAGRPDHRDHPPQGRDLPGPADRQADHREPRPEADAVRGIDPAPAPGASSRRSAMSRSQLGWRADLCRDRDEAALRRRGAPCDPRCHGEQHPARNGSSWSIPTSTCATRPRSSGRSRSASSRSEDVFIVDRTATAPLDPYTNGGYSSAVGIDATKPFGVDFPDVSEVPGWRDFDLPEIDKR